MIIKVNKLILSMESDQIFDTAQETPYRLCLTACLKLSHSINQENIDSIVAVDGNNQIQHEKDFLTCFDVNDSNKILKCTQDGHLRVIDLANYSMTQYSVAFQTFLDEDKKRTNKFQKCEENISKYHWDKLELIPGRPNHFFFLLGVSKTILYTSLPTTLSTSTDTIHRDLHLSSTTREAATLRGGFIYGSPVLELISHSTRVTSMKVSRDGKLLASGDENGILKLMSLHLLDYISESLSGLTASQQEEIAPTPFHLGGEGARCKISRKIHDGPIFSLTFIASFQSTKGNEESFRYSLATGSQDRAVKLWTVHSSRSEGLEMVPMLALTTLSANILCLDTYRFTSNHVSNDVSYYLAAGTHVGAVYLWRLQEEDLRKSTLNRRATFEFDDGSYLHSLLPTCDRPAVSVSLSETLWSPQGLGSLNRLIMAVTDTHGFVKIHYETDALGPDLQREPLLHSNRFGFGPMIFTNQLRFDVPVIAASFQPNTEEESLGC